VTLYGQGLSGDLVIAVGDVVAEIVESGQGDQVMLRTPPGNHGVVDILVQSPLSTLSLNDAFIYTDLSDLPGETWLGNAWPHQGASEGGDQVALSIFGLPSSLGISDVTVTFNGEDASIIEARPEDSLLVVLTPPGNPGPASIKITTEAGAAERHDLFYYEQALEVTSVEPATGGVGGGNTVTLDGVGFSDTTTVHFGHAEATSITWISESELRVVAPTSVPGMIDLRLQDGARNLLVESAYEYVSGSAPKILAMTPNQGSQAGGRIVRFHGRGLSQLSSNLDILFGRTPAYGIDVMDDATIVARAPAGDPGSVNLQSDAGLLAMAWTYFDPTSYYGGTFGGPIPEALNVTVLDSSTKEPIPQAFVILWDDLGTPYQGVTDARGQLTFSDIGFGPFQMVTASKGQYTTSSVVDFDARDVTLWLIHLAPPSPPGGGGGGGGQALAPGKISGGVYGMDKKVFPPPGNCDHKNPSPGALCDSCESDDDCTDEGAQCTDLGEQGNRCTIDCEQPSDCPEGFACVGVGFGSIQCIPQPGERLAWCGTTIPDIFSPYKPLALDNLLDPGFTSDTNTYLITEDPGEKSVVCFGGYVEYDTQVFIPQAMGVRRHIFVLPDSLIDQQDIMLDIPLSRDLRVRLDDPPMGIGNANWHEVDVFLDLGADGVFPMPANGRGEDTDFFVLEHFPSVFEESLYDASYTVYAGAYKDLETDPITLERYYSLGTFTLHKDIVAMDDDAVFTVEEDHIQRTQTGIRHDVRAMDGPGDSKKTWAVGDEGLIIVFDGTWWALQQAPVDVDLNAVFAVSEQDVWAAGVQGSLIHFDGIAWTTVAAPATATKAHWRAIAGKGTHVWFLGDHGLFRHDGLEMTEVNLGVAIDISEFSDMWASDSDDLWLVGKQGKILRITGGEAATLDVPGQALNAIDGTHGGDVWMVGDKGRVLHWNGTVFFDYLPVTNRTMRAVHAHGDDRVTVVGDAGQVIQWDGMGWTARPPIEHIDLRATHANVDGTTLVAGMHTLVIGPFLHAPIMLNPDATTGKLSDLHLQWTMTGPAASFTYMTLTESGYFPFWALMIDGFRDEVTLPDLNAAWGLISLWPGNDNHVQMLKVYMPGFDIDRYDYTMLSKESWRSWVVSGYPLSVP